MSTISFAPLEPDAVRFLTERTGIDYSHCDFAGPQWLTITARDGDKILGVFIGEFQVWFEVRITCAIDDPRFLTRRLLQAIFSTLFSRAVRLTAQVQPENEAANRIVRHLGFQFEGFMRLAIDGRWDANLYGMLRQECRYLAPQHKPQTITQGISDGVESKAA
jgi:hypothetical protein